MSEELKPCPFCGGEADIRTVGEISYIECATCHCQTESVHYKEKNKIIEAWNKRPSPWHTGIPTEMGEYLVCRVPEAGWLFRYNQIVQYGDLMGLSRKKIFYIGEPGKIGFENVTDSVVAWQKIEPYKGEKE